MEAQRAVFFLMFYYCRNFAYSVSRLLLMVESANTITAIPTLNLSATFPLTYYEKYTASGCVLVLN